MAFRNEGSRAAGGQRRVAPRGGQRPREQNGFVNINLASAAIGFSEPQDDTERGRYCLPIEVVRRFRSCAKESNILFVFFHTFLLAQESIAKKGL